MSTQAPERSASELAQGARGIQLGLRAELVRDVTRMWPRLNFADLGSTWPAWLQVMSVLLRRYHARSVSSAALYYQAARQSETGDPGGPGLVLSAGTLESVWVDKSLGWSAPGVYSKLLRADTPPPLAAQKALVQTLGVSSRLVMDGGRRTIADTADADDACYGYARITDGNPCRFCAMVASRGAVYKTAAAAGESRRWHNHCGCTVAPSFTPAFA